MDASGTECERELRRAGMIGGEETMSSNLITFKVVKYAGQSFI